MSDSENSQQEFLLTEEKYKTDFLPIYKKYKVEPKYLVQFFMILPFHIPFIPGICTTACYSSNVALTLHFSDSIKEENGKTIYSSSVEITYVTSDENIEPIDQIKLTNSFDALINYLNSVILSYHIYKNDIDVFQIKKEMLTPIIPYRIIFIEKWSTSYGLFILNFNIDYTKNRLLQNDMNEILRYTYIITQNLNPFISSEKFIVSAQYNYKNGLYKEAIILLQIGIEVFFKSLLVKFLESEKITKIEIDKIIEALSFKKIVNSEIPKRLGGTWDLTQKDREVGKWYSDTYGLRNNIVHDGYEPTNSEVKNAFISAYTFQKYTIDLLFNKKKKYREIIQYFKQKQ